ncbi:amino acid ABC transporter permease [Desulfovibrio ferrophilus]|uniref:Amino acid ABC transporter permease n=1 Tax=Desulfovibrio ferrophilus TaxID=241368 RepID=A0A2Z6B266_9BACT|nr:amino acid ABC transporter permease [Desulfovibrio ferrophilus]BBD09594.1 amino acid ABC transporter permease [Desulfovibrio ferrophilus]
MHFEKALNATIEALPYMLGGVGWTAIILIGALLVGFVLGVPLACCQVYGRPALSRAVGLYVWLFRGVPILVQLFLFYFGLLPLVGIDSALAAGVIVLGFTSASYQSQIVRGSIQSLSAGQLKAARALGMSDFTAIKSIILPQALRLSIPGWSNEFSILLKDSALLMVISVPEIMARTRSVAGRTHEPVAMALFAAILYFILTYVGIQILRWIERKVRIKGYSQEGSM